jgi:hypothetical protein
MQRIINITGLGNSGSTGLWVFLSEYGYVHPQNAAFETLMYSCSDGLYQLGDKLFSTTAAEDNTEAVLRFREMTINSLYFKQLLSIDYSFITDEEIDKLNQAMDEFISHIGKMEGKTHFVRDREMIGRRAKKIYDILKVKLLFVPADRREEEAFKLRKMISLRIMNGSEHVSGRGRMYVGCTREEYLSAAKKFIEATLPVECEDGYDVLYSHLIHAGSINRVSKDYFDGNIRTLISWRDPRDQFAILKGNGKLCDAHEFARYYKRCLAMEDYNTEYCKSIRLEDMIFNHEKTAEDIVSFLDIKDRKGYGEKKYNPEESAHMAGLYLRPAYQTDEWRRDFDLLERELPEYIYDWETALKEKGWYDERYK